VPQNFLPSHVDQLFLMPPDTRDWLAEEDLAWLVVDVIAELDLRPFLVSYRGNGQGRAAFDPAVMLGILLYAHAVGVRSSRAIERACQRDVAFRVVSGHEAGMVGLGVVSVDGTKIAADASWSKNYTEAALDHQIAEADAAFAEQARQLLAEHADTDAAEDALFAAERGDELPAPLRRQDQRRERLKAAKKSLQDKREAAQAAQEAKRRAWQERQDAGQRGGREPGEKPAKSGGGASGAPPRANTTDPESRAMRCKHTLLQGDNAQAAVTEDQVIVGMLLTQAPTDQNLVHDVIDAATTALQQAGIDPALSTVCADAGYANEKDFARAEEAGWHLLAPLRKDHPRVPDADPAGGRDLTRHPATARAQRKLRTRQGQHHYRLRGHTVEPVFAHIKDGQGLRCFSRRGINNVTAEWWLAGTIHNMGKLHKHRLNGARIGPRRS
jgi:transposase